MSSQRQPWADDEWVQVLQEAIARRGTTEVARILECSTALVSQLAKGVYKSPIGRHRERVLLLLTRDTVTCPVLGAIDVDTCRFHRTREFAATNPTRVRLYRACQTCPNNPDAD